MDIQKKEFTGVWIPREVAEDYSLNAYEKILYVEIASFPVCYMLNKTLAERIGASEKTVSRYIKTLIDKGYLRILKNDGRKRYVQAVKDFPVKSVVIQEMDGTLLGGQSVYSDRTICLPSMDDLSTIDNSIENKEKTKNSRAIAQDEKKSTFNPKGAEIIKAMEDINPSCKGMYGNKTQRKACDDLIQWYGLEKTLEMIELLHQTNGREFLPVITTPKELLDKWMRLENGVRSKIDKVQKERSNCIFV